MSECGNRILKSKRLIGRLELLLYLLISNIYVSNKVRLAKIDKIGELCDSRPARLDLLCVIPLG